MATTSLSRREPPSTRGLSLLSLDGGGIRGISSLLILQELMRAIDNENPPKPCEVFDMIGGTSTGGLIAIMLGRLRMSVEECIDAYEELAKNVFAKQSKVGWRANLQGRFSSHSLEKAIKNVLRRKDIDIDAYLRDRSDSLCRTFVCATNARNSQTIPLRSYDIDGKITSECKIWEAARATSAASSFFDPITVGDQLFADGSLGSNNPINQLWSEASVVWSQGSQYLHVNCIVSIGTGIESDLSLGLRSSSNNGNASMVFKTLAAISTESDMTANAFAANVLECHISASMLQYLNEPALSFRICADFLRRVRYGGNFQNWNNSAILPGPEVPFLSYERPFLRYSLESNASDSGYASSESTSHLEVFQEEFVELIYNHDDFARLLDIAANNMVSQEFQNSFTILLKQYAAKIAESTVIPFEREAADFINTRCQHITRALWVRLQSMTEVREEENDDADEETMRESKQALMSRFLKGFGQVDQTQSSEIPVPDDDPFGSTDLAALDEDRWKGLPALEKIKGFLTTHTAFEELLVKFKYGVHGSLLHLAIFNDDASTVSQILDNNIPVNIKDVYGVTALSLVLDLAQYRHRLQDSSYTVLNSMLLKAAIHQRPVDIIDESLIRFVPWTGDVGRLSAPETIICDSELSQVLDRLRETLHVPLPEIGGELLRKLENTVVVTGSGETYQATTCKGFVEGYHNEIGAAILGAIVEAYCRYKSLLVVDTTERSASFVIEAPVMTSNHVVLPLYKLNNTERFYAIRILIWLCKAVRLPPSSTTSDAKMYLSATQQFADDWCEEELGFPDGRVAWYTLKTPEEFKVTEGNCWIDLFGAGMVAEHQLSRRDWALARGLEIPFEILVNLAAAQNYVWIEDPSENKSNGTDPSMKGGYILLGFYTALIPTASDDAGRCIQWHFEFNESHILHPTNLQTPRAQWLQISDPNLFWKSKCFVGWCGKANVMVGTRELPNTVEWSKPHTRSQTLHTKGFSATAQAGGTAGPIQLVAQGAQNFEYVTNRQHFTATTVYEKAIVEISRQVALVYDSETQQAWLLPKLSVLLHLCHTYFRFFKDAKDPVEDPVPFADASVDGSQAARTALTSKGDILVTGRIRLDQILIDINVNITDSGRTRESPKGSLLFGSELMDMLSPPGAGTDLAEVKTSPPAEAWIRLAQYADAIFVCSKLGQALKPIPDVPLPGNPCCDCTQLPTRRCYLAAHIWCLEMMLQRRQCHVKNLQDQVLKINEDTIWCLNGRPFNQCPHNGNEHYWDNSKEVLQKVLKPRDKVSITPTIFPIPISGALVFGIPPPKVLRKKAQ